MAPVADMILPGLEDAGLPGTGIDQLAVDVGVVQARDQAHPGSTRSPEAVAVDTVVLEGDADSIRSQGHLEGHPEEVVLDRNSAAGDSSLRAG